jgi:hypothetical protein
VVKSPEEAIETSTVTAPPPSAIQELPTLTISPEGLCKGLNGADLAGAERYLKLDLQIDGSQVTGTETLLLYANTMWSKNGGADCQMVWSLRGELIEPHGCSTCKSAVQVRAIADVEANSCPEAMFEEDGGDFESAYDLNLLEDGTARIHFSRNGKLWAEGYHLGGHVIGTSDPDCVWF